ncbi:MAG: hypothetical protein WCL04_05400 [Verrucomicrobiota bacterium]
MRLSLYLAALVSTLLLSGCTTFEKRAEEKSTVFAALDEPARARLKAGKIALGDTADMVYMALGLPGETHDQVSADGNAVVWIYHRHWQEYQGERVTGYRPITTTSSGTGTPTVIYQPMEQSIYQDREEERLRVTLKDGIVTTIEQPKP